MLSANKEKVQSFLTGSNQFIIPFFQRAYVWNVDNWTELWDNLEEEIAEIKIGNNQSEHFIGTIIIKQKESEKVGALEYDLIDGQQRLTTICLLLRAFYDFAEEANLKNWIKNFLVSVDSYGEQKIRIIHSKVDAKYFQKLILDENGNIDDWELFSELKLSDLEKKVDNLNNILGAYIYFRYRIEKESQQDSIRDYINIILEKLPVIHMALSKNDDVQQIFDTINSLGVKLTTAELLKNYLYSKRAVKSYYDTFWSPVFEADEDAIEFWNRDRTSGRIRRTTVELFLYSYLVINKESSVKIESLFKEFKEYLKNKDDEQLISFAKEIFEYAEVYKELPDGENLTEISFIEQDKRFLHIVREFEITTIFPLILFIYKNVINQGERNAILNVFESYLTRRTICKLTTKNYNNLFISLLAEVKKMAIISAQNIKEILSKYTEDTSRFPNDDEFKKAFHSSKLINKYSREVLYCIALYQLNHDYTDNPKLNINGFSVEHIMPKKWRNHWNDKLEKDEGVRDFNLLTLGNLALVKGKLNSSMRDSAWLKKRDALRQYSTLRQTTDYLHHDEWNEDIIEHRGTDLSEIALNIWTK